MIPQRVQLAGFLCYKDKQEVRFDGARLWVLTGANGSGKSSIFDALTYALFGHHRGGSQNVGELINRNSTTLEVEFDFTLDSTLYRIRRTVRRRTSGVASTQQVLKFVPASLSTEGELADGSWEPLPDTQLRSRFDAWVKDKLGLDYETFTSSVLLLQGKSEKLLDSTPAGRAGVLARIVDLERYQKLHAKADEKRRELKGKVEELDAQLQGVQAVEVAESTAAAARVEAAEAARNQLQERIDGLVALELQTLRWIDAGGKLDAARDKLRTAEALLAHAVSIEKEYARLRELHDVLPAATTIVTERNRISGSERATESLIGAREAKADERRETAHALDQAKKKLAAFKKTLVDDEASQSRLNSELRELAAVLEKVRQAEETEAEVKRLEGQGIEHQGQPVRAPLHP